MAEQAPAGARVLDAGTGAGALAARMDDLGYDVVAADLQDEWYAASPPLVKWDLASPTEPPDALQPASFDCAVALEVIEHVENPRLALRNLHSLLRPGGRIIVSTPNVAHPYSRLKFFLKSEFHYFAPRYYYGTGHITPLPAWLLAAHLVEAGFEAASVSYAAFLDIHPRHRIAYRVLQPIFAVLGLMPRPRHGDGVFVTARRPN